MPHALLTFHAVLLSACLPLPGTCDVLQLCNLLCGVCLQCAKPAAAQGGSTALALQQEAAVLAAAEGMGAQQLPPQLLHTLASCTVGGEAASAPPSSVGAASGPALGAPAPIRHSKEQTQPAPVGSNAQRVQSSRRAAAPLIQELQPPASMAAAAGGRGIKALAAAEQKDVLPARDHAMPQAAPQVALPRYEVVAVERKGQPSLRVTITQLSGGWPPTRSIRPLSHSQLLPRVGQPLPRVGQPACCWPIKPA